MAEPVLLIGAGGFVGRHLLEAMARHGEDVIALSRSPFAASNGNVEAHIRALREPDDLLPFLDRVRAVVHVASATTPGSSAGKPLMELEENMRLTLALLEALQSRPQLPLIYTSSGGALCSRPGSEKSSEVGSFYSRSYHGAGKLAAEQFIEAWCHQCTGTAVVFRPSNLYGPWQSERPGFGIIPAAFGKIMRNEELRIWGDGSSRRDYLYIDDFSSLVMSALRQKSVTGFNVFNACSGYGVDLNSLLLAIEQVSGQKLRRRYDAARVVDALDVNLQSDRASTAFGWRPRVGLMEGLERTWEWFATSRC